MKKVECSNCTFARRLDAPSEPNKPRDISFLGFKIKRSVFSKPFWDWKYYDAEKAYYEKSIVCLRFPTPTTKRKTSFCGEYKESEL